MLAKLVYKRRSKMCFDGSGIISNSSAAQCPLSDPFSPLLIHDKKRNYPAGSERRSSFELVEYDKLPEFLKHNEFILSCYRSEWPLKQTLLSIFSLHNETINIWTHLIGFFIFLMLITASFAPTFRNEGNGLQRQAVRRSNSSSTVFIRNESPSMMIMMMTNNNTYMGDQSHVNGAGGVPQWPFYAYLMGAMFCLLMSSASHLLCCRSPATSYVMMRLDFAGISGLIVSSFYPIVCYGFACSPLFRALYLSSITVFGVAAVAASLVPVFDSPQFRPVRAGLFACMAASGVVPIAHKMAAFGDRPEAVLTTAYEAAMGGFYGLGVVVYATRVPERWLPGRFDIAGHSHQLFHVLVVAGAYTHYLASSVYLTWRQTQGC